MNGGILAPIGKNQKELRNNYFLPHNLRVLFERSRNDAHTPTLMLGWAGGPEMLVITRREGEEVVIGNPASPLGVVRITSIKGDRVRIAFEFPREIAVHRREVADEIIANEATGTQILGQIRPAAEA